MSSDRTDSEWRVDPAWALPAVAPAIHVIFGIRTDAAALGHDLIGEAIRRTQRWSDVPVQIDRVETAVGFDGVEIEHVCTEEIHRAMTKLLTEYTSLMAGVRRPVVVVGYRKCPWDPMFREIR